MAANRLPNGKKILVIDDNHIILKSLAAILSSRGYTVVTALDGPDVINCLRLQKPDLILLDLFFPPNALESSLLWDGFLILAWLHSVTKAGDIPTIVISGTELKKYKNLCQAIGVRAFFSKPLNLKRLLGTIRAALRDSVPGAKPKNPNRRRQLARV